MFEADAETWGQFEAEKQEGGVPGGMSFAMTSPLAKGGTGGRPVVKIGADAHHFSPADLEEAGMQLLPTLDVELDELSQFSTEPPAKVFIEYGLEVLRTVPSDLLAALLYDALKGLIRKRRSSGGKTTLDFVVSETPGLRLTSATLSTESDAVALKALEAFVQIGPGRYRWDGDDGPFVSM
ncbi:MAG: hypothetical protein HY826_11960 [Actinobacteria bacterium]|nr:hypothetical protein [Actinomycetota bacterium]